MNQKSKKNRVAVKHKLAHPVQSASQTLPSQAADSVRTLYFHTGTHKTGSTALQAYLAANKTQLAESGVSYEFPEGMEQTMGNGQYFYNQIYDRQMSAIQLDALLEFYLSGRSTAICSSEDFTRLRCQEWQQVKDACQRLEINVKFVTFIRDIAPYYYSLYGQFIKGGEIYASFDEFCMRDQYFPVLDSLKCLSDLFGQKAMSVIHYESVMGHLDSAFMPAIGLFFDQYDNSTLKQTVNRSLNEYEQEILTLVNATSGRQYSLELADFLMRQRPNLKPTKHIDADMISMLTARHGADIEGLNQTFFGGGEVVKISSNVSQNGNALSVDDRQAIDRDVAIWCISKLQSVQDNSIRYVADRLRSVDWKNAGNPAIPDNFDPLAYLLSNPDVLKAGVQPYEHFIGSGRYEDGRRWEWMSQ